MRESWVALLTLYVPMVGVPILLFAYMISLVLSLDWASTPLLYLSMIGLLVFGISGLRDVYIAGWHGNAIVLKTAYAEKTTVPIGGPLLEKPGVKFVRFNVKRFNPGTQMLDEHVYDVETDRFTTVLDGLLRVKSTKDPTLSMRYSCRMGICGSCGMVVNGKPSLACETNVWDNAKNDELEVSPMLGHPLLKDLVTDFDDFFERHVLVNPYLFRNDLREKYHPVKEYPQSKEQLHEYLPFSYCIMCGLCLDACPVVNMNPEFIGPQALSQAYRYYADSRDEKGAERLKGVDILKGVWDCEFAGSCSEVCPKGVDPAFAIQLLKTDIIKNDLRPSSGRANVEERK